MRIGVLGAGRMGGTIARGLGTLGHEVTVAARRPRAELAGAVASWTGVTAGDPADLVGCEVVFLVVPWRVVDDALAGLDLRDHVVVDVTNPFSSDYEPIDAGPSGSTGHVASLLPGARVVKALNTLPDEQLAAARDGAVAPSARRPGVPVAADDEEARDVVADLVRGLGCTPVFIGGLDVGRRWMQPTTPLFMVPLSAAELEDRVAQLRSS